jgi:hypothetical protein
MTNIAALASAIGALVYEEDSFGIFVLVSISLGGGAAWLAGRAVAVTWRPLWQIIFYSLVLGGAARFIHFALFDGTLLSLHYYTVDSAICLVAGLLGFRTARAAQMVDQYPWINAPHGPLGWRRSQP